MWAVSYTHLDVYKRQGWFLSAPEPKMANWVSCPAEITGMPARAGRFIASAASVRQGFPSPYCLADSARSGQSGSRRSQALLLRAARRPGCLPPYYIEKVADCSLRCSSACPRTRGQSWSAQRCVRWHIPFPDPRQWQRRAGRWDVTVRNPSHRTTLQMCIRDSLRSNEFHSGAVSFSFFEKDIFSSLVMR